MITVKGPGTDHKVILWEKDALHPKGKNEDVGEIFVVNDGKEYKVGETPAIKKLIHEERLVKVDVVEPKPAPKPVTPPAA